MPFCKYCGQNNKPASQFCTRCGAGINSQKNSVGTTVSSEQKPEFRPSTVQPEHASTVASAAPVRPGKGLTTLLVLTVILGVGIGAYAVFFNRSRSANAAQTNSERNEPGLVKDSLDNINNNKQPVEIKPDTTGKTNIIENPRIREMPVDGQQNVISEFELEQVSKTINGLYNAENRDDIDGILSFFSFPAERYYDMRNVTYYALKNRFNTALTGKLSYHHITPDYATSQVKKTANGYFVIVSAYFEYITYKTPSETKGRNVVIKILLNNDYKITSAYE